MLNNVTVFEILLSSPGDLSEARKSCQAAVAEWNVTFGRSKNTMLQPLLWENHSVPLAGGHPQTILNAQLVDRADFCIAMFWTRLGTPTGLADSGTVEEIERFLAAGKPVLVYFSQEASQPHAIDPGQLAKLQEFRTSMQSRALIHDFNGARDLHAKLLNTLTYVVDRLLQDREMLEVPEPIRKYLTLYPQFRITSDMASGFVQTSRSSFFSAAKIILDSLAPGAETFATDSLDLTQPHSLYWCTEGLVYLRLNFECALRGVNLFRLFIITEEELTAEGGYVTDLCKLHALAGVNVGVALYERIPSECRQEIALFGDRIADEAVYDFRSRVVIQNRLYWAAGKVAEFRDMSRLLLAFQLDSHKFLASRASSFSEVEDKANELRAKYAKGSSVM